MVSLLRFCLLSCVVVWFWYVCCLVERLSLPSLVFIDRLRWCLYFLLSFICHVFCLATRMPLLCLLSSGGNTLLFLLAVVIFRECLSFVFVDLLREDLCWWRIERMSLLCVASLVLLWECLHLVLRLLSCWERVFTLFVICLLFVCL